MWLRSSRLTPRRIEQPEHDHQRQIEAAEGRGVEERKGEVECAAAGEEPDFVAVPHGADGAQGGAAFRFGADEEQVEHADAEVEAVEDDVADDHYGDQPEPDETHHDETFSFQSVHGLKCEVSSAIDFQSACGDL